jgi:hypothetical protein
VAGGVRDPRLDYQGPYRNIDPSVAYVGNDACISCHQDVCDSYANHPMGQALTPMAALAATELLDAKGNPFTAEESEFRVVREGNRVWHRETRRDAAGHVLYTFDSEVHFAIGSGAHGRSYLTSRDGYLFQTPVSWYSQKKLWDLSPGFSSKEFPGRPIPGECLRCHANRGWPHENSENRFDEPVITGKGIGCERCHGPGARHVESRDRLDIVNPARLTPKLRDAVCEQCHLEGVVRVPRRGRGMYDFRPGMPLEEFFSVFVFPETAEEAGKDSRAVSHVEQMHASRCYQKSKEKKKLGCISCHDPHSEPSSPGKRIAFYRGRCLDCHTAPEKVCSAPEPVRQAKKDSCIDCHMPHFQTLDIAHAAGTDHRVLKITGPREAPEPNLPVNFPYLVSFHRPQTDIADREYRRDLGIALASAPWVPQAQPQQIAPLVLRFLEDSLTNDPSDLTAWEAKADAFNMLGRHAEALAAAENILERAPEHERALALAAAAHQRLGENDLAIQLGQRAIAANPWSLLYRTTQTLLLVQKEAWEEARPHAEAWRRLQPASVDARKAWIGCLLHDGKKADAEAELKIIKGLQPDRASEFQTWFEGLARRMQGG